MSARIRAAVVDDEPMARALLHDDLTDLDGVEVVGDAADGGAAVELIEREEPDVVFLDIEMPELSGLGVVRSLERPPLVVFVTAHHRFAVDAFDLDVLDYLTKPVRRARLEEAVARVRRELRRRRLEAGGGGAERPAPGAGSSDVLLDARGRISRFVARAAGRIRLVRPDAIRWVGAAGNYVELHTADDTHLVRTTLTSLAAGLDPDRFRRIHRSYLVNLDQVREIRSDGHGAWRVELRDGPVLRMTATYRDDLLGPP